MRFRVSAFVLAGILVLSIACTKTSSQPADNGTQATQNPDSSSVSAQSEQPPAPVTITIPAGKVVTVRLADAVGSKISQHDQSFGGSLAKPVEIGVQVAIPAGTTVEGGVVAARALGPYAGRAL